MEVENFEKRDSMTETVPQPAMGNRENNNQAPVKIIFLKSPENGLWELEQSLLWQ